LFVSDSGNNWILVLEETKLECIDIIGTGVWGDTEGDFSNS